MPPPFLLAVAVAVADFQEVWICGWRLKLDWMLAYWAGLVWIGLTIYRSHRKAKRRGTLLTALHIKPRGAER